MARERLSTTILQRLRQTAAKSARPSIRNATIDRLVQACDAIESGDAETLIRSTFGKTRGILGAQRINPTNLEKYVVARSKTDPEWIGPHRVLLQRDRDLNAYLVAREDEREKPTLPNRPTTQRKLLEDAISKLPTIEMRMDLRYALEDGRQARRLLNLLTAGLRSSTSIDVDSLMAGTSHAPATASNVDALTLSGNVILIQQRDQIRTLLERLLDAEELARAGLEFENDRIRVKSTKQALIKPSELKVLRDLSR